MTIQGCMGVARQISAKSEVPLILMGYYNPVLAFGIARFCQVAAASGVSGLIIPDLPSEEAQPLSEAAQQAGLALSFLIPPTTPDERIASIIKQVESSAGSFIYCVSLSGVTGARDTLPPHLSRFVAKVYGYMKERRLPLVMGFGLSRPEHIAEVTSFADGAAVGSALVRLIDAHEEHEQVGAVREYVRGLKGATAH
jgi:tryptophan synthase alpha chain